MNLFGAGGHAQVIMGILRDLDQRINQIYDDAPDRPDLEGHPINTWEPNTTNGPFLIAIGDNRARNRVAQKLGDSTVFKNIISPRSIIDPTVQLDTGNAIMPGVLINPHARIGSHCVVNTGAVVEHHCEIKDFVHVAPNATLCGACYLGEGVLIGAGAVVLPGVRIGAWSKVGAGSVVTRDVEAGVVVAGNPARNIE